MIILYYEPEIQTPDELINTVRTLKDTVKDQVIAIPKNYDVLLNCSIDQLISVRTIIDTAITMIISKDTSLPTTEEITDTYESNIIKFSDYLS